MNVCRRIFYCSYKLIRQKPRAVLHTPFVWKYPCLLRHSAMSQRSITSFFNKTPKKSDDVENTSPGNNVVKQNGKRTRMKSEENESPSPPLKKSATDNNTTQTPNSKITPKATKKKTPKSAKKTTPKFKIKLKESAFLSDKESETYNSNGSPKQEIENNEEKETTPVKSNIKNENISDVDTPVKISKKKAKRQRLVSSSGSENSDTETKDKKISPKTNKKSDTNKKNADKSPEVKKEAVKKQSQKETSPKENKKAEEDVAIEKETKDESPQTKPAKPATGSFFTSTKDKNKQKNSDDKEKNYNPAKSKYHPIEDAPWSRGEKVPYLAFAKTLEAIEATSARLKIIEILSNYLRSVIVLSPADLLPSIYMCLNKLAPAYESLELGVAETYLMKAIAQSTGRTLGQIKLEAGKIGDLGLVAEQCRSTQRMMFQPAPLTVPGVFMAQKEVAYMTGQASMAKKVGKIQSLFIACRQSEARYFIRSLAGKLRIGLAEQSVLQALAQACATTPPCQTEDTWPPPVLNASKGLSADDFKAKIDEQALIVKTTYCNCPNYDLIIPVILKHGVAELPQHCKLTPRIPLKPMLAHPTKGIHEVFQRFENLKFTCEWKYDGERAQIHVPSNPDSTTRDLSKAAIFSRNQEDNTSKYPDVLGRLEAALKPEVVSCVLDCEAVAWDREKKQILPFQILSTRKRKDASAAEIKVQVCLFMFDLLYLNGRSLVTEPLAERRRLLVENFNQVEGEWLFATSKDCTTMEEVQEFLEDSIKGSCEGLMVKTLAGKDATYEIAKRSKNWLKLKKDYLDGVGDTLDIVVIGGYLGRGKRAGVYGGFLLACHDRDADEYQSVCKIGTGFTEEDLVKHSEVLNAVKIDGPRNYYRYDTSHEPDVWFSPSQVWEVRCADLSLSPAHRAAIGLVDPDKGISLRFPRFVRIREDKTPEEATSSRQVADIYLNQDQVKNQGAIGSKNIEDDFY